MADAGDLIDFDIIETQKENIQSLPSGRSAKALANLFSPLSSTASPLHTQDLNNSIRADFEKELESINEVDDPLDICDRYVKWTLDAYPSAQATPQSQLLPLLERSTTAFLHTAHYKNDPRYLKLWLLYIRLFSDAPRETFAFLARHGIGDGLALYYEEFAAWLETAGRWAQAEEIYRLGLVKNARPLERLQRKFSEFEHRYASRAQNIDEPSSPALPVVRSALAVKLDPFSVPTTQPEDPQAGSRTAATTAKSGRAKLAIFSDADEPSKPGSSDSSKGWESIGTFSSRKKENAVEVRPWAGETLKAGKSNTGVPKMMVFKDPVCQSSTHDLTRVFTVIGLIAGDVVISLQSSQQVPTLNTLEVHPSREQQVMNPKTGRYECVFVNLEAVYPNPENPSVEFCFEELRARHRGWLNHDWGAERRKGIHQQVTQADLAQIAPETTSYPIHIDQTDRQLASELKQSLVLNDVNKENEENAPPLSKNTDLAKRLRREERANKTRKIRVREVKGAPQTIQTNLDSPTGPKLKRKKSAEPTMTVYTKAATDEIYEIFNQPLKAVGQEEVESGEDSSEDDYTSGGESTGTGKISGTTSEYGEETRDDLTEVRSVVGDTIEVQSLTELSQFRDSEDLPKPDAEISTQDSRLPGEPEWEIYRDDDVEPPQNGGPDNLITPTSPEPPIKGVHQGQTALLSNDYARTMQVYRDSVQVGQSRLPFMTPIVETTESSLGAATAVTQKDYFNAKTPCRKINQKTPTIPEAEDGHWSSPFQEIINDATPENRKKPRLPPTKSQKVKTENAKMKMQTLGHRKTSSKEIATRKGPVIKDAQCNPVDEHIRTTILNALQPPLFAYEGYFNRQDQRCGKGHEIRKFCKAVSKMTKNSSDKTSTNISLPPTLRLEGSTRSYKIKRELGKGAFAPVYLAESSSADDADIEDDGDHEPPTNALRNVSLSTKASRRRLAAIKMEDPPSPWEFYILSTAHERLGPAHRATQSVIRVHEFHLYADECYLIEDYHDQGTLLDLVNTAKAENPGAAGQGMEELLVAFYTIELLRTTEALHSKGIIHGDLKADNVLARFEPFAQDWSSQYSPSGENGWASKGVTLIDFGRGIDMSMFREDVGFIADWETSETDCREMREGRHWSWQVDYWGLAGVVHTLLWGRYFDEGSVVATTTAASTSFGTEEGPGPDYEGEEGGRRLGAGGAIGARGKSYRLTSPMKRYWNQALWTSVFDFFLNPVRYSANEEGGRMPCLRTMRAVREEMEEWLGSVCERGVGLKGALRRLEERCAAGKGRRGGG